MIATSYEIIIKTEPFLNFKKQLYKKLIAENNQDEEVIRRKFYRFMDDYLKNRLLDKKFYSFTNFTKLVKIMDEKFRDIKEGSFIIQDSNIGYIENGNVRWVRFLSSSNTDIRSYLPHKEEV